MVGKTDMKRNKEVSLQDLVIWPENPRIESVDNEREAIESIYKTTKKNEKQSRSYFVKLAESILERGFENEVDPVLVTEHGERYLIKDGNRRVSAMKVLLDLDSFKDMLDAKDYSRLKRGMKIHGDSIPLRITVAVFGNDSDEQERLNAILLRKHTGPQEGAGIIPWTLEAKDRLTGKKQFSDRLEVPFEKQFGQSLTSYLGGTKSKSSTRRIFSSKPVKDYLNIINPETASPEILNVVRQIADLFKDLSSREGIPLSRMNNDYIAEALTHLASPPVSQDIPKTALESADKPLSSEQGTTSVLSQNTNETAMSAVLNEEHVESEGEFQGCVSPKDSSVSLGELEASLSPEDFTIPLDSPSRKGEEVLGGLWNRSGYMIMGDERFTHLNTLLSALALLGKLNVGHQEKIKRIALLSPSCRVFFEVSITLLQDTETFNARSTENDNSLAGKVERVGTEFLNNNKFLQYLSHHSIVSSSFRACKKTILDADFKTAADKANDLSHRSMMGFTIEDVLPLFNSAVLFSYLCEHYIAFKEGKE